MTSAKRNGPAGIGAVSEKSSDGWTYRQHSATLRRREDASRRLPPIRCSQCFEYYRDPARHRCPRFIPTCGCYRPDQYGHRNETCDLLGELIPPRWAL